MKTILVIASLGLGVACIVKGCVGLILDGLDLLDDSQVIAAEEYVLRSAKSVSRWIWSSLDASKAQNPLPSTAPAAAAAADQDSISTKTPPDREEVIVETRQASPHFLTKIESFSLLSEYGIIKYETRAFEAGDYKWRLVIYRESQDKGNHVSVYLTMADTSSLHVDWEFNATFTIFLYNQISDNYLCYRVNGRRFNEMKSEWGFSKFISKKEELNDPSNGYLVDDTFVLGAEIFVYKRQRVIENVTLLKPTESSQKREWKIQEFSKFIDHPYWVSEEITIRDVNWNLALLANGYSTAKGRGVSMFFTCVSAYSFAAHQKVKVDYQVSVKRGSDSDTCYSSGKLSEWFTSSDRLTVEFNYKFEL